MKVSVEAIFPKGKKGNGEGRREVEAVGERRRRGDGEGPWVNVFDPLLLFSPSPHLPFSPCPLLFVSLLGQAPAEALLFIIHQSSFIILWCALV